MGRLLLPVCLILACSAPLQAANVNLSATLTNSCVLSIGSGGTMTANAAGTQIGSENAGGSAATLTLTAIGGAPTVTVAAPTLTQSPAGWSGSPTLAIKYSSTRGANQAYTSSQSSYAPGSLSDTLTFNGKVDNASGFAAGTYTLTTVVTCAQ